MTEFFKYYFIDPLNYEFIQRALIASVAVGISCGLIGTYIMLRKMSLIGDALAHAVLPGVVIGFMIAGKGELALFTGAVISGIITSVLIGFVNRNSKIKEDTSIGIIFTGAFALGILLVSQLKGVHIDLSSYLFGDVLGVSSSDIMLSCIITSVIILCVILFYKQLLITSFDPTMAVTIGISVGAVHYGLMALLSMSIVAGLQSVGVVLLVAMLITPAATAYLLTNSLKKLLVLSCVIGVLSSVTGLYLSYHFNFSSGASIVLTAVLFFILAFVFSPSEGLFIRYIRRKRNARSALSEDVLKLLLKHSKDYNSKDNLISRIASETGYGVNKIKSIVYGLVAGGLVFTENDTYRLTDTGQAKALKLIRSHRLWESYAARENISDPEQLHPEAEKLEHVLPEDLVDEMDEELGYPARDPHGSEIPRKK